MSFKQSYSSMAPHSRTLAWKIPWTEEPGRLQSMGSLSRTWLNNFTFTFHFHALEKEMATHSSVLAWRIPGMGEPGGLPSMGSHRVGHDWSDLAAFIRWNLPLEEIKKHIFLKIAILFIPITWFWSQTIINCDFWTHQEGLGGFMGVRISITKRRLEHLIFFYSYDKALE